MRRRLTKEEVMTIRVLEEKGVSKRSIARQLGVSEGTVRYQLKAGDKEDGRQGKPELAAAVGSVIERWMEDRREGSRPVNVQELHEQLVSAHGYTGSYRSVLRYVRRRWGRPPIRTYRRVETVAGAQSQTDWGEFPRVQLGSEVESLSAFVMVLSHSRYPAVVWSWCQDQVSWLWCHNEAFRRLKGIPATNRIDNVKTALAQGAGAWGVLHPTYKAYARSVGFHIDACPPRAPQAKGKSEAKVRLSRLLLDVERLPVADLEELQAETDYRVDRWADRAICPATGMTVKESWLSEQEQLAPLALLPEPFDVAVRRPVHRDATVHFEGRQYTIPFAYVGRHVDVRGCAGRVQIFADDELLREYPRHTAERLLIDPTCYEGESTDRALAPPPLGKMGRKLQEIQETPVAQRPVDLYHALMEVAR